MKIYKQFRPISLKSEIWRIAGIAIIALALPFPAPASLGGDMATVQADQMRMQGTLRSTNTQAYNIHEIQAPNGVAVREFVSPAGKVFGVAWQGSTHPDLRQILGTYFDQFTQAVQAERAHHPGHGPLSIQTPGLVVQLGGHMRAFVGRVYVPEMMPVGVRAEEIR
jgi:Protein of unknown function (DUF2844)